MRRIPALVLLVLAASLARAEAELSQFHPKPRPLVARGLVRPLPRPSVAVIDDLAAFRPMKRPDLGTQVKKGVVPLKKGAVCAHPEIKGKALPAITPRTKGCQVADPVLVSEIAGVKLVPPATISCDQATALSNWVTRGLQPAFDNAVVRLNVVDSYACRPRNNVPGNPVSVHGLGQAIDIAGFKMADGSTLTVADNYGRQIKAAQKAGCGIFHTILGPGSDGYHENHIHFDVAPHGGGDYCR